MIHQELKNRKTNNVGQDEMSFYQGKKIMKNRMAYSVDPDEIMSHLIWIYTVCKSVSSSLQS